MTITEVLKAIHRKYEFNIDYFDSTEEDYSVVLGLVNEKINLWENEKATKWRELHKRLTGTFDSSGTDPTFSYYAVTDFITPASRIEVADQYLSYISPEILQEEQIWNPRSALFTVINEDDEQKIIVPKAYEGHTFNIFYYKRATQYVTGEETVPIEMSDPYFLVHAVVAELFLDDGDTEKGDVAMQIAMQKLEAMRMRNEETPVFVDVKQPDYGFRGFGN